MTVESITCPNCGASLAPKPGQDVMVCEFCKTSLRVSIHDDTASAVQRTPESPKSATGPFQMTVQDVFLIKNMGTIVTGCVASGTIRTGDTVVIHGAKKTLKTVITKIEMFHKVLEQAKAGDNVGLMLKNVGKEDVRAGDIVAALGS